MKRFVLLIILMFILMGCDKNDPVLKVDDSIITASPMPTVIIQPTLVPAVITPKATNFPTISPIPKLIDNEITESLTTYMYESFGGSGDKQIATSWYKYINSWEVNKNNGSYIATLQLTERPYDTSARILLSQYYSEDELDELCPILLDTGAKLALDDIDLCLIGECLYKIRDFKDVAVQYYALLALDIPIYEFLSDGFGKSEFDVQNAIETNKISGIEAYQCLVDYMAYTYKDSFDGLSMQKVKYMSMAALSGFDDVRIEELSVVDQDGSLITKYENLN